MKPLKDTARDVPLLTQIAHPMKLSAALFVFNDVLVSWLLGGGGEGGVLLKLCLHFLLVGQ